MEREAKTGTAWQAQPNGGVAGKIIKISLSDSASDEDIQSHVRQVVERYQLYDTPVSVLVEANMLGVGIGITCPACGLVFQYWPMLAEHIEYRKKYGNCMVS